MKTCIKGNAFLQSAQGDIDPIVMNVPLLLYPGSMFFSADTKRCGSYSFYLRHNSASYRYTLTSCQGGYL